MGNELQNFTPKSVDRPEPPTFATRREVAVRSGLTDAQISTIEEMAMTSGRRKVGAGALHNVIVNLQSAKNQETRFVESGTCEYVLALQLELDPDVVAYYTQVPCPRICRITPQGRRHVSNATLDFLVFRKGAIELVECKTSSWLLENGATHGYEQLNSLWTHPVYQQFAQAQGIAFKLWVSPDHVGILLRNLEACYATRDDPDLSGELDIEERVLSLVAIGCRKLTSLIEQVPGFNTRMALRLLAKRKVFAPMRGVSLDDTNAACLFSSYADAESMDMRLCEAFSSSVSQPSVDDPLLTASPTDTRKAERRWLALQDIDEGRRASTRRMTELKIKVDAAVARGVAPLAACLTSFHRCGNRERRVTVAHRDIAQVVFEDCWQKGRVARPIDLYREFVEECKRQTIEPCGRYIVDNLRRSADPMRHALTTGGMRAYQAIRPATDPTFRTLPAMGFGHTVHIDSSKFDNRIAPCLIRNLPAECATFYVAVDEAANYLLAYVLIFGPARTEGLALLMREIVRRNGFLPRVIHYDRGPENRSNWIDEFCAGCTTQRFSPTAGSAWNGIAENMIKQINEQVAHRLLGSTVPDKASRKVDGRFKSRKNALTSFETVVGQVESFVYGDLPSTPDESNITPEEKRAAALVNVGLMGVPTTMDDDFMIRTSVPVALRRRVDPRRGMRTEMGYYSSAELIRALRTTVVEEARADCNYPEIIYVRLRTQVWLKAFHSTILLGANRTDLVRLFDLLIAPILRSAARKGTQEIGQVRHKKIEDARRRRSASNEVTVYEVGPKSGAPTAENPEAEVPEDDKTNWSDLIPYQIEHAQ